MQRGARAAGEEFFSGHGHLSISGTLIDRTASRPATPPPLQWRRKFRPMAPMMGASSLLQRPSAESTPSPDVGWFLGAALPATLPRDLCGNVPKRACCGIRFSDGRSVVIATENATVHSEYTVAITTMRWAQFWFREQAPLATAPHTFGEGGTGGALLPQHHLRPPSRHQ